MADKMPQIVCVGRKYGSGGREIGERLAEKLGVPCYDKLLIKNAYRTVTNLYFCCFILKPLFLHRCQFQFQTTLFCLQPFHAFYYLFFFLTQQCTDLFYRLMFSLIICKCSCSTQHMNATCGAQHAQRSTPGISIMRTCPSISILLR